MLDLVQHEAAAQAMRQTGSMHNAAALLKTTRRILSYGINRVARRRPEWPQPRRNAMRQCADCQTLMMYEAVSGSVSDLHSEVAELRKRRIAEALRATNGNRSAAARMLGVRRTTLVAWLSLGVPGAVGRWR